MTRTLTAALTALFLTALPAAAQSVAPASADYPAAGTFCGFLTLCPAPDVTRTASK